MFIYCIKACYNFQIFSYHNRLKLNLRILSRSSSENFLFLLKLYMIILFYNAFLGVDALKLHNWVFRGFSIIKDKKYHKYLSFSCFFSFSHTNFICFSPFCQFRPKISLFESLRKSSKIKSLNIQKTGRNDVK